MLLLTPLILWLLGLFVARLSKARRIWRRHGHFTLGMGLVLLVLYTTLMLGLLFDHASLRPIADLLGAPTGTAAYIGAGVIASEHVWPIEEVALMVVVILSFMLYPFWFWLGAQCGYWLFGRSPKQTGILGLLR